jgi:hypothetical protein
VKKRLYVAAGASLVAGLGLLLSGSPASAEGPQAGPQQAASSSEGDGILSGNSVAVPIAVPIEVACNLNGIAVLGSALGTSACDVGGSGAGPTAAPQVAATSASGDGVLSGNSVVAPISIPVEVCGNGNGIGIAGLVFGSSLCDVGTGSDPTDPQDPECPGEPQEPECPGEPQEPECPNEPEEPTCPDEPTCPNEPQEPTCPGEPPYVPEPPACPPAPSTPWMW